MWHFVSKPDLEEMVALAVAKLRVASGLVPQSEVWFD